VKNYGCTWFTITWNNNNFINSWFWNQNPSQCDIIYALYGTWTNGADTTAYTSNGSGRWWICNYTNMNVKYLTWGTNKIPVTGNDYTIYVLSSGTYIQNDAINPTEMGKCTSIIWTTGTILFSGTAEGQPYFGVRWTGTIFDNIIFKGRYGVWIEWWMISIGWKFTMINNFIADGVTINWGWTSYFSMNSGAILHQLHNDGDHGMEIDGENWIIQNTKFYENAVGLDVAGSIILSGIQVFRNNIAGLAIRWPNVIVSNSQFYNNTWAGIIFESYPADHVILNNIQSYNNSTWIYFDDTDYKSYITINNSQIYNNKSHGIYLQKTQNTVINNSHIYNNSW